jgi:CHAD domain-containing protein
VPYRFKQGETVPDGVRRIAQERVNDALEQLRGNPDSTPPEAIHEARKDMKKLRALLRLVRDELGGSAYRRENANARAVGRLLSDVRDADVMAETLDSLEVEASAGLRAALKKDGEQQDRTVAAQQAIELLEGAWDRLGGWPLEHDGFEAIEGGLRRTYGRGRKAFRRAREKPNDENLHEFRKRSKDLWYHHQLVQDAWPEALSPLADQAHELSDRLGDDHDLAVLAVWAKGHAAEAGGLYSLQELNDAIGRRREQLQAEAFELGERLYAERAKAFSRRLGDYWRAWQSAQSPLTTSSAPSGENP